MMFFYKRVMQIKNIKYILIFIDKNNMFKTIALLLFIIYI